VIVILVTISAGKVAFSYRYQMGKDRMPRGFQCVYKKACFTLLSLYGEDLLSEFLYHRALSLRLKMVLSELILKLAPAYLGEMGRPEEKFQMD
jgi:hypothetical protein